MIGLICRADKSGLGFQTRRLARMINPDKIMLIDSTGFNGNKQFPEWYKDYDCVTIDGFPTIEQIVRFLDDLDVVMTCETWYSHSFIPVAKNKQVKTICVFNWEFMDHLYLDLPLPDVVLTPSYWHLDEMKQRFNARYLPTPIFPDEFKKAREINLKRTGKPRYLFLNGKTAAHDRNGLESLYEALHYAKGDFEIVVKSQSEIKKHPDPRLSYDFTNPDEQWKLYADFDAMIMPRRYGGQCLPMTEALQSALPVIMPDIEPNNKVLPRSWLVPAYKKGTFMARTEIDIYAAEPIDLAAKIDRIADDSLVIHDPLRRYEKNRAWIEFAKQYDAETLRPQYEELIA